MDFGISLNYGMDFTWISHGFQDFARLRRDSRKQFSMLTINLTPSVHLPRSRRQGPSATHSLALRTWTQ